MPSFISASSSPILLTGTVNKQEDDCACPDSALAITFDTQQTFGQDCACPDRPLGFRSFPDSNLYIQARDAHIDKLPNEFWLAFSPYAPNGACVLNETGKKRFEKFQEPLSLNNAFDHTLASQNLIIPYQGSPTVIANAPDTLTAWLHITNACNLDCPYCYVKKSSASMSVEVGVETVRNLFRVAKKYNFQTIKLKYAGGEATLHFRLLKRIHHEAQKLSQETGITLRSVLLSNGVHIRKEDAEWIKQNSINLMVSVDGVGSVHDTMRPFRQGSGSFELVNHTVERVLLPLGIHPYISITITRMNASGIADTVKWALEHELPVSLNFYRQTPLAHQDLACDENTIIQSMLEAYAVFEEYLPEQPFLNGLLDRVQVDAHQHTCGVGKSYLVIGHDGKMAECQMQMEDAQPFNSSLDILPALKMGKVQNLSVDDKDDCSICPFRYRCTGGCPLETFHSTGQWNVKSPHCRIYKTLIPAALRLEGLRLLKTHNLLS